jgi:hypothetical protein
MARDKKACDANGLAENDDSSAKEARRTFLKKTPGMIALVLTPPTADMDEKVAAAFGKVKITPDINNNRHKLTVELRVTLLDLLGEELELTGTKKAATTASAAPAPTAKNYTPCRRLDSNLPDAHNPG